MNIVLLSGGSGQRLWPLSNDIRSKQFIKIFHTADGELESMVQRVYRQIRTIDKQRLKEYVCHIDSAMMKKVDEAICVSLNLPT